MILFVSIGPEPASELCAEQLACDSHGFVWVDPGRHPHLRRRRLRRSAGRPGRAREP
jgi:hypothetical protein